MPKYALARTDKECGTDVGLLPGAICTFHVGGSKGYVQRDAEIRHEGSRITASVWRHHGRCWFAGDGRRLV